MKTSHGKKQNKRIYSTKSAQQKILERTHQYGERETHPSGHSGKNKQCREKATKTTAQNPRNEEN